MNTKTTVKPVNKIQEEIDSLNNSIQRRLKEMDALSRINVMLAGVDLSVVSYLSVDVYSNSIEFKMTLAEDHKDARLAAVLARHFGVKFEKEKSYWGESLDAKATIDGITFIVSGYVPSTCRIEEEKTEISEEEYQRKIAAAIANVSRFNVNRKIVCK